MIFLEELWKSYTIGKQKLEVLQGIDLTIEKGEMVAVMGSSGSGKSTLLNVLGLLDNYDSGMYSLAGEVMKDLPEKKAAFYRNKYIGFVFQSFNLLPFKNALENVALPLYYQKVSRKKRNRIADEYLEKVGLSEWGHHLPGELSGGQKQRIAIARALISDPNVILADEPTGALDSATSMEVLDIFRQINATGKTIVIVTHEKDIAAGTDRIIKIRDGVIQTSADEKKQENQPVYTSDS